MSAARRSQRGAALAIALLILVIITLLGVAAVRATQVEIKLSRNAESRMAAVQAADSVAAFVSSKPESLPVNENQSYRSCWISPKIRQPPAIEALPQFLCSDSGAAAIVVTTAAPLLQDYGYAEIRREQPLFVETTVLRDVGIGSKNYDFARFTVTGGYDHSQDGMSAAEVVEGVLRLHTKMSGISYE